MDGDIILETAKVLGITPPQVFERCAEAHHLRQAEVVAEDRHIEWRDTNYLPEYVVRWCRNQIVVSAQELDTPLFI